MDEIAGFGRYHKLSRGWGTDSHFIAKNKTTCGDSCNTRSHEGLPIRVPVRFPRLRSPIKDQNPNI